METRLMDELPALEFCRDPQENFERACKYLVEATKRIAELTAENERCREIAERDGKDYSGLNAKLKLATDALEDLVNSEVVKSAEFITYSEAYSNARETLAKLRGKE